jgi:starch synthase
MLLHPSRFEPCGLVPIYALRYGTVPIVRKCGGMTDTITDRDIPHASRGETTGFSFEGASAEDLLSSVCRALSTYRQPVAWRRIMRAGMRKDFGWQRSAEAYVTLYASLSKTSEVFENGENTEPEKIYA